MPGQFYTGARYPLEPLLRLTGWPLNRWTQYGVSGSTLVEYQRIGLTDRVADRLAVAAGFHPFEVWPEMADHREAEAKRVYNERKAREERRRYQREPMKRRRKLVQMAKYHDEYREWLNAKRRERYAANVESERAAAKARYQRRKAARAEREDAA